MDVNSRIVVIEPVGGRLANTEDLASRAGRIEREEVQARRAVAGQQDRLLDAQRADRGRIVGDGFEPGGQRGWRTHSPVTSPSGSPRTASTLATPASSSFPDGRAQLLIEWLTAVRCTTDSMVVLATIRLATATVFSRSSRPRHR
jgi:hypothetical protein